MVRSQHSLSNDKRLFIVTKGLFVIALMIINISQIVEYMRSGKKEILYFIRLLPPFKQEVRPAHKVLGDILRHYKAFPHLCVFEIPRHITVYIRDFVKQFPVLLELQLFLPLLHLHFKRVADNLVYSEIVLRSCPLKPGKLHKLIHGSLVKPGPVTDLPVNLLFGCENAEELEDMLLSLSEIREFIELSHTILDAGISVVRGFELPVKYAVDTFRFKFFIKVCQRSARFSGSLRQKLDEKCMSFDGSDNGGGCLPEAAVAVPVVVAEEHRDGPAFFQLRQVDRRKCVIANPRSNHDVRVQ